DSPGWGWWLCPQPPPTIHYLVGRPSASAQVLVEEVDRPLPRQLGRCLVVARGRVVVKAVVRAGVHELLVLLVVRLERLLEVGPARIDAIVESRVVNHQRRVDLCHVFRLRLTAVIRRGSGE